MTPVKICGITRVEDAVLAADLGATWIGFVFWPRSPRCVTPAAAADILAAMPPQVTGVGVFVNQPPADVAATIYTAMGVGPRTRILAAYSGGRTGDSSVAIVNRCPIQ